MSSDRSARGLVVAIELSVITLIFEIVLENCAATQQHGATEKRHTYISLYPKKLFMVASHRVIDK